MLDARFLSLNLNSVAVTATAVVCVVVPARSAGGNGAPAPGLSPTRRPRTLPALHHATACRAGGRCRSCGRANRTHGYPANTPPRGREDRHSQRRRTRCAARLCPSRRGEAVQLVCTLSLSAELHQDPAREGDKEKREIPHPQQIYWPCASASELTLASKAPKTIVAPTMWRRTGKTLPAGRIAPSTSSTWLIDHVDYYQHDRYRGGMARRTPVDVRFRATSSCRDR